MAEKKRRGVVIGKRHEHGHGAVEGDTQREGSHNGDCLGSGRAQERGLS